MLPRPANPGHTNLHICTSAPPPASAQAMEPEKPSNRLTANGDSNQYQESSPQRAQSPQRDHLGFQTHQDLPPGLCVLRGVISRSCPAVPHPHSLPAELRTRSLDKLGMTAPRPRQPSPMRGIAAHARRFELPSLLHSLKIYRQGMILARIRANKPRRDSHTKREQR